MIPWDKMSPSALPLSCLVQLWPSVAFSSSQHLKWHNTAHQLNDYLSLLMTLTDNTCCQISGHERIGKSKSCRAENGKERARQMADHKQKERDLGILSNTWWRTAGALCSNPMHMFVKDHCYSFFTLPSVNIINLYFVFILLHKTNNEYFPKVRLLFGKCASALDTPYIFCIFYGCRESGISSVSPPPRAQLCLDPGVGNILKMLTVKINWNLRSSHLWSFSFLLSEQEEDERPAVVHRTDGDHILLSVPQCKY